MLQKNIFLKSGWVYISFFYHADWKVKSSNFKKKLDQN